MFLLIKQSTLSSRQSKKSNIIQAWICALSLGLSSCSPGMFFGNGVDQKVLNLKSSRRINKECGNMDVSTSQFTLTSFRGLVQCLNANRSMEPIAQFVSAISDQDLAPLVQAVNQSLVGQDPHQQKRFYELERTYQSWVQQGIHKDLFKQSGKVLSYSDFWMSLISILRSGFYESGTQTVNLNILKAIELLSVELDSIAFERSLRVGLTYAEAPSFVSLQTHLSDHPLSDAQVTSLAQSFMDFVNQPQGGGAWNQREKFKAEIVWAIQNNRLFPLLDRLLGPSQEQIATKAPELAKVFKGLLSSGGALGSSTVLMDDLTAAFRDLSGPVSCMKGSKEIKDATRYLIRELAEFRPTAEARDYITREAPLTFMALGPFCSLPPQMTQHYPAMFRLAESGVLEPMVDLLKVLYAETREIESSALQREVGRGQGTEGEGEVRLDGAALSPVAAIAHDEVKRPWIDLMFAMFLDPGAPHLTPILKTLS